MRFLDQWLSLLGVAIGKAPTVSGCGLRYFEFRSQRHSGADPGKFGARVIIEIGKREIMYPRKIER